MTRGRVLPHAAAACSRPRGAVPWPRRETLPQLSTSSSARVRCCPRTPLERLELRLALADALHGAGDLRRVGELLEGALAQAEQSGKHRCRGAGSPRARVPRRLVDPDAADLDEILDAAEHAAEVLESASGTTRAWRGRSVVSPSAHWLRCRVTPGEPLLERALEHARRAGDAAELSEIRKALIAIRPCTVSEAIIAGSARRSPLHRGGGGKRSRLSERYGGPPTEARELSVRSRKILEDLGLTLVLPTLDGWTGQPEMLAGDPQAAERIWRRAYQALEGLGEKGNLSTIAAYLAEAAYVQGRDDEAAELTEISESHTASDDVTSYISWRSVRAKVEGAPG